MVCVPLACLFVFACPKACWLLCVCVVKWRGMRCVWSWEDEEGAAHMMSEVAETEQVCKQRAHRTQCIMFCMHSALAGMFDKTNNTKTRFTYM